MGDSDSLVSDSAVDKSLFSCCNDNKQEEGLSNVLCQSESLPKSTDVLTLVGK